MVRKRRFFLLLSCFITFIFLFSCTKNDVQFGTALGETFTHVTSIDTVAINMSTVITDSFATNNDSNFLLGRYKDSYLGLVSAKPFFQISRPADTTLPSDGVYDSLRLIINLDNYYYGDTSKNVTVVVRRLTEPINYSYGNRMYNTSSVAEDHIPLGSRTMHISPSRDSISVRLDDVLGKELFDKMQQDAVEFQDADHFTNYFKGLSISYSGMDSGAIVGFKRNASNIRMRLYYHSTIPYPASGYRDFGYDNSQINFNQLIADRNGTRLPSNYSGEVSSALTNNVAFSQSTAGVLLKMTFPSLRNILQVDTTIRLLKATLVLKVAPGSYDPFKFKLPPNLFLVKTDVTNAMGATVTDAVGGIIFSAPSVDYIYNTPASFSFDVTTYINTQLSTSGSQNNGLLLMQNYPGNLSAIDRVIINDSQQSIDVRSRLILSVLTIKN